MNTASIVNLVLVTTVVMLLSASVATAAELDLEWSTFLGGSGSEYGFGIAVDASGDVYITGETGSSDFFTTPGGFETTYSGGYLDVFVAKLNASGTTVIYSTYLGGIENEWGASIAVDGSGSAYITGLTNSVDFPTTPGALDTSHNGGGDVFVSKLNRSGTALSYSTFLGSANTDRGRGIALDSSGKAYIAGETSSSDFPTTPSAFDTTFHGGGCDAFVAKLDAAGATLEYCTFLGGSGATSFDYAIGIALNVSGEAHVTGYTSSADFPTTSGAFDTSHNGEADVFVSKLSATGHTLRYSTFLGGEEDDRGRSIALDMSGQAYVTGDTQSTDFPTTPGALDTVLNNEDAFAAKLNAGGNELLFSTFLGGDGSDRGAGIEVDSFSNVYVAGHTYATNFPTTADAFDVSHNGSLDTFLAKLNGEGTALLYSTFLGGSGIDEVQGIALNSSADVYIVGQTTSLDYPTTTNAFDTSYNGSRDVSVAKFNGCVACDYNSDNQVNFSDLSAFSAAWGRSCGDAEYLAGFDANTDCVINFSDLSYFSSCWGQSW